MSGWLAARQRQASSFKARSLTRDLGFYRREGCHRRYGLVYLAVTPEEVAIFVRRVLRYPTLNTRAKRMGTVIRASHRRLALWRLHAQEEEVMLWEAQGD